MARYTTAAEGHEVYYTPRMPCLLRGSSPGERELFSFDHFADLFIPVRALTSGFPTLAGCWSRVLAARSFSELAIQTSRTFMNWVSAAKWIGTVTGVAG